MIRRPRATLRIKHEWSDEAWTYRLIDPRGPEIIRRLRNDGDDVWATANVYHAANALAEEVLRLKAKQKTTPQSEP